MSNHTTAAEEIKRAWLTAWQAGPLLYALPVEHENQRFTQPATGPWGRLTLVTGETEPAAIGNGQGRLERTPFVLFLQVFMPENTGTKVARQAADIMRALDRMSIQKDALTVNFRTTGLTPAPNPANTGLTAYNVQLPGQYDIAWSPQMIFVPPPPPPPPPP